MVRSFHLTPLDPTEPFWRRGGGWRGGKALFHTRTHSLFVLDLNLGLPTFCRIVYARDSFETGPVSLGRFGIPIGIISCVWIVIITVLFVLPTLSPVDAKNMNYTVVIVAASAIYIFGNWYFNARHWFKGPVSNIDLEDNENDFVAGSMNKQEVEVVGADKAEYDDIK